MKIFILLSVLMVTGCVSTENRGLTFGMTGEQLKMQPNEHLCMDAWTGKIQQAAMDELISRQVNCTPVVKKVVAATVPNLPAVSLCSHIISGAPDDIMTPSVNKEVKKRGLDCPAIMQAEYTRQGAMAAEESARAQRAAAWSAMNAANAANRPRTTNCTGFGSYVNCTSY